MKVSAVQLLQKIPWVGSALMLIVPLLALTVIIDLSGNRLAERILIGMFINMVLVVGLQLFTGNSGLVSFGHISFMAVGAYASVLLITVSYTHLTLPTKA